MCKLKEMKSFIGNPFDPEYVDEDDDEMQLEIDFLNTFADNRNILPSDEEEGGLVITFGPLNALDGYNSDDSNDPDYQMDPDEEDSYSEMEDLGFDSEHNDADTNTPQYVMAFSSDEEEDEIDYVTYPLKTDAQESSTSSSNVKDSAESSDTPSTTTEKND